MDKYISELLDELTSLKGDMLKLTREVDKLKRQNKNIELELVKLESKLTDDLK